MGGGNLPEAESSTGKYISDHTACGYVTDRLNSLFPDIKFCSKRLQLLDASSLKLTISDAYKDKNLQKPSRILQQRWDPSEDDSTNAFSISSTGWRKWNPSKRPQTRTTNVTSALPLQWSSLNCRGNGTSHQIFSKSIGRI